MEYLDQSATRTEGDIIISCHGPRVNGMAGKQIIFRVLTATNLEDRVKAKDLSDLFGFDNSEFLRKYTSVEIKGEGQDKASNVICPDIVYDELLIRLNGIEFLGRISLFVVTTII